MREFYTDSEGRRWLHEPHYGVYIGNARNPWITYTTEGAAQAVCKALNENNIAITPSWLGKTMWAEVREVKGIEIVD